jgi:hypothetical protein
VNHTETELFLQRLDQMKVRLREANCRRFEFLVPDHCPFLHVQDSPVVAQKQLERRRQLRGISLLSQHREFSLNVANTEHGGVRAML